MGGLFSPKTPKLPDPTPVPDTEDPALVAARRRRLAASAASQGAGSTILSDGGRETLGG